MDERGTASVEVVVMLPFFLLCLFGIYFVHDHASARSLSLARARGCAWQFATAGCPDHHDLVNCGQADIAGAGERVEGDDESVLDRVSDIPVLGALVDGLFGTGRSVTSTHPAPAGVIAAGSTEVTARYFMVCNTVPRDWKSMIADMLKGAW